MWDQYYSFLELIRAGMSEADGGMNEETRKSALTSIAEVREIVSTKEKEYKKLLNKVFCVNVELLDRKKSCSFVHASIIGNRSL